MFTLVPMLVQAQFPIIGLEKVKEIKSAKMIVGLTDDEDLNASLRVAVDSFWTFNRVVEYLPLEEAKKKAKEDDKLMVLSIGSTTSKSLTHDRVQYSYRYVSKGKTVEISRGKKAILKQHIPAYGKDEAVSAEAIGFGLAAMQHICSTMVRKKLKNSLKLKSTLKESSTRIRSKTLYIPEGWLSEKLDKSAVKDLYGGKVKVVSYEEWRDAILTKQKGIAYTMVVPVPIGGDYVYVHYLMDAEKGRLYAALQKTGVKVQGINLSKSNTGYITKKNMSLYGKAREGDW
ncbi:MAG: hypothetical protein AAGB22_08525 [Bacteroidota bacterium]